MNDITTKLQVFESPFKKGTYSRNVWDMQLFNGKIYIGQGNSANCGIDQNAGPIPITSFNPANDTFTTEFTVDEEQIDIFKVLNGKLVIPGHDSRESWDLGNFYTLDNVTGSVWRKFRTIPRGIHVFDMEYCNGQLFAGLGTDFPVPSIVVSNDFGLTWTPAWTPIKQAYVYPDGSKYEYYLNQRWSSMFEFKGTVYAVGAVSNFYVSEPNTIKKFDGKTFITAFKSGVLIPDVLRAPGTGRKIIRTTKFGDKLLYIGAIPDNDQQSLPGNLYMTSDIANCKYIALPDVNAKPMDILVRGNKAYVLSHIKPDANYTNIVYESTDLITWTETLRFTRDTFARSFEEYDGVFYFGLGTNISTGVAPASTGTILRARYVCPSIKYCTLK